MPRAPKKTEKTPTAAVKRPRRAAEKQPTQVSELEISRLAYELYEARGRTDGAQLEDWLQAKQRLSQRAQG